MNYSTKEFILSRMDELAVSLKDAGIWMLDIGWSNNPRRPVWRGEHDELGTLIEICLREEVPCSLYRDLHQKLEHRL